MIGKTVERWNCWKVERLKEETVEKVESAERWNSWTLEKLKGGAVEDVSGWGSWTRISVNDEQLNSGTV